jgi:CRISPR-associated protein NE0113 (Cas_NE0113)
MRGLPGILVATVGTKPQVVTTALDLLLRDGCSLGEVVVVHHAQEGSPVGAGLERLRAEFAASPAYHSIQLRLYPIPGPAGRWPTSRAKLTPRPRFAGCTGCCWRSSAPSRRGRCI